MHTHTHKQKIKYMSLDGKSGYYLNWNFINQELPILVNKVNMNFQVKTDGESESTYVKHNLS